MQVTVNGKQMEFEEGITLAKMLEILENKSKMIVIEQNRNIISKDKFETTPVQEGDDIEVITFTGGG